MNAKTRVIIVLCLTFVVLGGLVYGYRGMRGAGADYVVADQLVEDSPQGRVVFSFVEMESLDSNQMRTIGDNMLRKEKSLQKDSTRLVVLIAQFYRLRDTLGLTPQLIQELSMQRPGIATIAPKLQYIKNGWMYRAFSRAIPGMGMPGTALMQTSIVVPKKGYKIKDLMGPQQ